MKLHINNMLFFNGGGGGQPHSSAALRDGHPLQNQNSKNMVFFFFSFEGGKEE